MTVWIGGAIMHWTLVLYNLVLFLGVVGLSPVWLLAMARTPKFRAGFSQKNGLWTQQQRAELLAWQERHPQQTRTVWLHAVSVGEFNAIRPLIQALCQDETLRVAVSTTTLTGQTLARSSCSPGTLVFYFPFDLPTSIDRTVELIQPDLLVLTETEIWPNVIDRLRRVHRIPVIHINGRLSEKSYRGYRRFRPLMRVTLRRLSHLYMQADADAARICALGAQPEQVSVCGNIKFDLPIGVPETSVAPLRACLNFPQDAPVLVCASTHPGEEALLLSVYRRLLAFVPDCRLVLAPRHPERADAVAQLLVQEGFQFERRTACSAETPNVAPVVLLDTIGELMAVFALSTMAVVGGSFIPHGGHNPLEPLCAGIPVAFGPYMFNFAAIANGVLEAEAGVCAENADELLTMLRHWLADPEERQRLVRNGHELLVRNRGTKTILLEGIHRWLSGRGEQTP
jgi:3-deoxy-D-manno-octulosonic-acid transferase